MMETRFKKLANDYVSTGGNCMVDITTVYDQQEKVLLYAIVSDESMLVATYNIALNDAPSGTSASDYIRYGMPVDEFNTNDVIDELKADSYLQLLNDCWLSFIRNRYEKSSAKTYTAVDNLPVQLHQLVDKSYAEWLDNNGLLVTTDGYKIIVDDKYIKQTFDSNGIAAINALQKLNELMATSEADDDPETFYSKKIQVIIDDKVYTFGMSADVYNGLYSYMEDIIDGQK